MRLNDFTVVKVFLPRNWFDLANNMQYETWGFNPLPGTSQQLLMAAEPNGGVMAHRAIGAEDIDGKERQIRPIFLMTCGVSSLESPGCRPREGLQSSNGADSGLTTGFGSDWLASCESSGGIESDRSRPQFFLRE